MNTKNFSDVLVCREWFAACELLFGWLAEKDRRSDEIWTFWYSSPLISTGSKETEKRTMKNRCIQIVSCDVQHRQTKSTGQTARGQHRSVPARCSWAGVVIERDCFKSLEVKPDVNDGLTVSVEWNGTWGENECLGLVRSSTLGPEFILPCVAVA